MHPKIIEILKKIRSIFFVSKICPVTVTTVPNRLLENKTALITGGAGGIGFAIAKRFTESGCKVILCGIHEDKLKAACEKLGSNARYLMLNVLDIPKIQSKIQEAVKLFSDDGQIDILVNSAGIHGNSVFETVTESEYDSVLDINLKGTFFMCKEMSIYMKEKQIKGRILNISSASSIKPAWAPYEISKWGVRGFTLGLARELIPYEIVVNSIAPGPVATPMLHWKEGDSLEWPSNPSGRLALPDEIGNLAVFMVSDLGKYIVGDTFFITGGSGTICIDK